MTARVLAILVAVCLVTAPRADPLDDAWHLAESGDRDGARTALAAARASLPVAGLVRADYLEACLTDDWEVARERFATIAEEHAGSEWGLRALTQLGEGALLAGEPELALGYFERALASARVDADAAALRVRKAQSLLALGDPTAATEPLRQALALLDEGPDRDRAELMLTACDYEAGRYADGLQKALALIDRSDDVTPPALLYAARCLTARGEGPLALQYLDQLVRDHADTAEGAWARHLADSLGVIHRSPIEPMEPRVVTEASGDERTGSSDDRDDETADAGRASGRLSHDDSDDDEDEDGRAATDVTGDRDRDEDEQPTAGDGAAGDDELAADDAGDGGAPFVDVGAFPERVGALSLLSRLRRRGVSDLALVRSDREGHTVFVVRVGPYADRETAEAERDRLAELSGMPAVVTR